MQLSKLDELYAQAAEEVANGQLQNGLWHRMFTETDSDEKVARARYLRERVKQLQAGATPVVGLHVQGPRDDAQTKLLDYRILANLDVQEILPASNGLAMLRVQQVDRNKARLADQVKWKHGYLDLDGNIKIQPKYGRASSFVKGFAYVSLDDGLGSEGKQIAYGVIDTADAYVVLPKYQYAAIENNNIFLGKGSRSNGWSEEFKFDSTTSDVHITKSRKAMECHFFGSKEAVPFEFRAAWKKWPWQARLVGKFGFADRQGRWVVPAKYDEAIAFKNGRGFVGVGPEASRKFFMIDASGNPVGKVEYDHVGCYWGHEGDDVTIARVINCGEVGYAHIDQDGNPMYNSRFLGLGKFNEFGFAGAWIGSEENAKGGLINEQGEFVFQSDCGGCHHLMDDLVCVQLDGLYGVMNFSGEWIVRPSYTEILRFWDDKFIFRKGVGGPMAQIRENKYAIRKYRESSWYLIDRADFSIC